MPTPTERFVALVREDPAPPLDIGALLIAAHAHPGLDVAAQVRRIDELARSCPAPTLGALREHLFRDLGFSGAAEGYDDPCNSYLNDVLDRRMGIPITLSVLTIEVGRRIGVPLVGIGLPGHFLVRHEADPPLLLDPFNRGRTVTSAECEDIVRRVYGPALVFDASMLAPVGNRAVLARMLANLKQIFAETGDAAALEWVVRLRIAIPEVGPGDLGDLANAQVALGRYEDAAETLEDLAGQLPEETAGEVAARAVQLRARLN